MSPETATFFSSFTSPSSFLSPQARTGRSPSPPCPGVLGGRETPCPNTLHLTTLPGGPELICVSARHQSLGLSHTRPAPGGGGVETMPKGHGRGSEVYGVGEGHSLSAQAQPHSQSRPSPHSRLASLVNKYSLPTHKTCPEEASKFQPAFPEGVSTIQGAAPWRSGKDLRARPGQPHRLRGCRLASELPLSVSLPKSSLLQAWGTPVPVGGVAPRGSRTGRGAAIASAPALPVRKREAVGGSVGLWAVPANA